MYISTNKRNNFNEKHFNKKRSIHVLRLINEIKTNTNFYNNICEAALIEQSFSKSDIEHVQIAHR